jgi:hypothetical protein
MKRNVIPAAMPPTIWVAMYAHVVPASNPGCFTRKRLSETAGLKLAPETEPRE